MKMQSIRIFLFIIGLIFGWVISCAHAEQELKAEKFLDRCVKEGSVALVDDLTSSDEWQKVTNKIATGDEAWVDVAGCLFHGVYFGEDEWAVGSFLPALAQALRKNPNAVLFLEHSGISLRNVCSLPFDEENLDSINDYMNEVLPLLDKKAIIGERVNIDHAKICAIRMRDAYERIKVRIREREELIRRQNIRNKNNKP